VKNITVSVPEDVYRAARVHAAERGRSVSSLVAEFLRSLPGRERELDRLEEQRRRIIGEIKHFSAADRLDRDAVHERAVR
jgi:hypothetical protein